MSCLTPLALTLYADHRASGGEGPPPPEVPEDVEAHLATCPACRAQLAEEEALIGQIRGLPAHGAVDDPGDAFFASLADRIAAEVASAQVVPLFPDRSGFADAVMDRIEPTDTQPAEDAAGPVEALSTEALSAEAEPAGGRVVALPLRRTAGSADVVPLAPRRRWGRVAGALAALAALVAVGLWWGRGPVDSTPAPVAGGQPGEELPGGLPGGEQVQQPEQLEQLEEPDSALPGGLDPAQLAQEEVEDPWDSAFAEYDEDAYLGDGPLFLGSAADELSDEELAALLAGWDVRG